VIELDNPYVLTLYHNIAAHRRMRPVLRSLLLSRRCAGIVCISKACRSTLESELGGDVADRASVVYPYIARGPQATPGVSQGPLKLICVGTQFWLKGGRELCAAVGRLADRGVDVHLTIVSRAPSEVREHHQHHPIEFVDHVDRSVVTERLLPAADVFVLPSVQESFGLAALEALAAGLPILATDLYALPELVQDGTTGILLADPLGLWRPDGTAEPSLWTKRDIDAVARDRPFPTLRTELERTIEELATDRVRVRSMGIAAQAHFETHFAPEQRAADFSDALLAMLDSGVDR